MLDAAEALIRQCGGTDFSMRALAAAADVSPTTPYNFFGSKEGLLFELLARSLRLIVDEALQQRSEDPFDHVIEAGEAAVRVFLRDPVLMRPLYQVVFAVSDPLRRPRFVGDAYAFYTRALQPLVERRLIGGDGGHLLVANALMAQFIGVLDLWIHEDIADEWFLAQTAHGFALTLWPYARGASRKRLQARIEVAGKTLSDRRLQPRYISLQR